MSVRRPPRDQRPLRDPADLTSLWRTEVASEPFRVRSLWLLFIDARLRPAGPLLTIDDLPDGPYDVPPEDLTTLCGEILDGPGGGGSVALLLTRPGGDPWTVSDRAWARFLTATALTIGSRTWPVHWAHRRRLDEVRMPEPRQRSA